MNFLNSLNSLGVDTNLLSVLTIFGLLFCLYKKYIWKWLKKFHYVPDLSGKWEGKLVSSYIDEQGNIEKGEVPTEELKIIFDTFGIKWNSGENFIDSVQEIQAEKANAKFFDTLLRSFNATLQMRNSIPNSEIDYLVSPVMASDGTYFDSREQKSLEGNGIAKLPVDADANGAYHIALKGLSLINKINLADEDDLKNLKISISNADWFKFAQEKAYEN